MFYEPTLLLPLFSRGSGSSQGFGLSLGLLLFRGWSSQVHRGTSQEFRPREFRPRDPYTWCGDWPRGQPPWHTSRGPMRPYVSRMMTTTRASRPHLRKQPHDAPLAPSLPLLFSPRSAWPPVYLYMYILLHCISSYYVMHAPCYVVSYCLMLYPPPPLFSRGAPGPPVGTTHQGHSEGRAVRGPRAGAEHGRFSSINFRRI